MISPRVTISRFSFGISRPTTDLPGMISTTRTLIADSARARSLDRLLIWLTLTPGRRAQLEARDHRAGLHRHHLGLDAEVAQLQLHQPRHGLERLVGIGLLARGRLIEQRQRRQFARLRRVEQRHLALALDALALLGHRRQRLDARRRPARDFLLLLAHDLLARLLALLARGRVRGAARSRARPFDALEHPGAELVHHVEPRTPEEQRHAGEPQARAAASRAQETQSRGAAVADEIAEHAAGAVAAARSPSQCSVASRSSSAASSTKPGRHAAAC